jgi:hypothetical protein
LDNYVQRKKKKRTNDSMRIPSLPLLSYKS